MISHKYKVIYIHLPKCGGTSIEKALTDTGWHTKDLHLCQHMTAQETIALYGDKIYETYFKFTIVRNTWDLLVSHYLWGCWGPFGRLEKWFRKGGQWGHPYHLKKLNIGQLPTFEEYLSDIHNYNKALDFSCSQTDLTFQRDAICIDGRLAVDFVGRFENLQNDFNFVCTKIDFPQTELKYANKSTRKKHYSVFYDKESKNFVARKYKRDIDCFNFFYEKQKTR